MSGYTPGAGAGERIESGSWPSEEEAYLEHRSALDATLFASAAPTLTFELERGVLNLVSDSDEGERPREGASRG